MSRSISRVGGAEALAGLDGVGEPREALVGGAIIGRWVFLEVVAQE